MTTEIIKISLDNNENIRNLNVQKTICSSLEKILIGFEVIGFIAGEKPKAILRKRSYQENTEQHSDC